MSSALVVILLIFFVAYKQISTKQVVTNYDECAQVNGSVIQESYPEVCVTKDGQRFVRLFTEEEQQNLVPTTDPTSGWNTYRNIHNNYQIKYPQDWYAWPPPDAGNLETYSGGNIRKDANVYPLHDIQIISYESSSEETFNSERSLAENWEWIGSTNSSSLTINGNQAWYIHGVLKAESDSDTLYWRQYVQIQTPTHLHTFTWNDSTDKSESHIFDQIIATFEFTDEENECVKTGCSGQVCSDEEVMTTCEYRLEYACYQNATCERQDDGECGWTQNEELVSCLESNSN
jgi:hypothetical protein